MSWGKPYAGKPEQAGKTRRDQSPYDSRLGRPTPKSAWIDADLVAGGAHKAAAELVLSATLGFLAGMAAAGILWLLSLSPIR